MKNLILAGLVILISISCQQPSAVNSNSLKIENNMSARAPFIHTVFFYLNDNVTAEQKKAFESGMNKLGTCSTIDNYRIGKPAMTPRDIVDNSYGYSWIVEFKTAADQNVYQTDPIHLEFIESYKDLWKEVKVYDSVMMD